MECYILLTIILITFLLFYKFFTREFNYWEKKGVTYIKPTIIFGNIGSFLTFKKSIGSILGEFYLNTKADVIGIWIFNTPLLLLKRPEVIKDILWKDFHHFATRGMCNDEKADPIFSRMLFSAEPKFWKAMRAYSTTIFTGGKIKSMMPLMNIVGENMENYLHKNCQTITNQEVGAIGGSCRKQVATLEVKELCAKFTTDVITSCAFGMDAGSFDNEQAEFRNVGRSMFDITFTNTLRLISYFFIPWLVKLFKFTIFDPYVYRFCRETFWFVVNQREKNGENRGDVVDALIKMKNRNSLDGFKFDGDTVVAQSMQFFLAGFETSSSTIAFALYELALNEKLQNQLREEIHITLKDNATITYDVIQDMCFLDKVMKETLRKYPPVPFLNRTCTKKYKIPKINVIIEKGRQVVIPLLGLHYNPEYFPEPDVFDPERFSSENMKKIPHCAYIPFGEGPHNCIAARMGLIMSKLGVIYALKQFKLLKTETTPVAMSFDAKNVLLRSKGGIPIDFVLSR